MLIWLWVFVQVNRFFKACRDETTDSLMLRSSVEEIKVLCVWAQHGEGRYRTHDFWILTPEL